MAQSILPPLPVILPSVRDAVWLAPDGTVERISKAEAHQRLSQQQAIFCHRHWTAARLGLRGEPAQANSFLPPLLDGLDALELFAFTRPAQFCLPTAKGLGEALGLNTHGSDEEDQAISIIRACHMLLEALSQLPSDGKSQAIGIAQMMAQGGWGWAEAVLTALGAAMPKPAPPDGTKSAIWQNLPENPIPPPMTEPSHFPLETNAVSTRLATMLGTNAERRPQQAAYAAALIPAFAPPTANKSEPNKSLGDKSPLMVLAEAGTGTGKTLGYLAPATLWAETNKTPVWVSTYTRGLQHQVAEELHRFYPDKETRDAKTVIRKGRENYLCLLNLDDALAGVAASPRFAIALGLMARWAEASSDGDLTGPNFPAWLIDLCGTGATIGLADRRGECIHSACRHYNKCFVEKSRNRAQSADIVVANHALVMIQAALAHMIPSSEGSPSRYIFDEGHHVFEAADSAFSTAFSGREAADLRQWIIGSEGGRRTRARGLRRRLEDLLLGHKQALGDLEAVIEAAQILPALGWRLRLSEATPRGLLEEFFFEARRIVYHRITNTDSLYNLECDLYPLDDALAAMADDVETALGRIAEPLGRLARRLERILADEVDSLDTPTRNRLEGACRGLIRRGTAPVNAWRGMVKDMLASHPEQSQTEQSQTEQSQAEQSQTEQPEAEPPEAEPPQFIDWIEVIRRDGQDIDIGLNRHHLDPSKPFSQLVLAPAHGAVITSATLTDCTRADGSADWGLATHLTGASHLPKPALLSYTSSPFDYASQTRVLVITDCGRDEPEQTASAMAGLMAAAGGGAMGLFTAIRRLKAVYPHLATRLYRHHIPLYAQHIDAMNLQSLLQIFRADRHSCLLGTDAVRDGIDVPGAALQLIIFDRVPWPRPNTLFKARASHFGRERWADYATRMKLRQAFGRLVRRGTDKGVFVMLDSRLPSRMLTAFPDGVEVRRCGLAEAIAETKSFLADGDGAG